MLGLNERWGKKCSNPLKAAWCWQRPSIKEVKWWRKVSEQVSEKWEMSFKKQKDINCRQRQTWQKGEMQKKKKRSTSWPVLRRLWVLDHLCLQGHGYFLNIEPLRILHAASGRSSPVFSLHDGRPSASSKDGIGQRHYSSLWVYPNMAQSIHLNWTNLSEAWWLSG